MAFQYSVNAPPESTYYVSHERIYVNAAGKVCKEDDPKVARLLVGEGGQITWAEAINAGLVPDEDSPVVVGPVEVAEGSEVEVAEGSEVEVAAPDSPRRAGRPAKAKSEGE